MSWEDLARMVKKEKQSGNPVASLIDKLHLERNCMPLFLSNNLDGMDDDEKHWIRWRLMWHFQHMPMLAIIH